MFKLARDYNVVIWYVVAPHFWGHHSVTVNEMMSIERNLFDFSLDVQ